MPNQSNKNVRYFVNRSRKIHKDHKIIMNSLNVELKSYLKNHERVRNEIINKNYQLKEITQSQYITCIKKEIEDIYANIEKLSDERKQLDKLLNKLLNN
ncbi:hypothetical protein A3Q56_04175 [Intoshia linei]|uniref:Uncharacterized protein n=1 Tax=Intoshia linei TaxID=1819745 RepID=A0A177B1G2_9BILA|nr:hypothetical protein A3Q56_04175 [Intoshia linei]